MSRYRFYILPFTDTGAYQNNFIEITNDVLENSIGSLSEQTSFDDYNIGIFKFNSFNLTLNNIHGKYSEPDQPRSIFRRTRNDCIVRITWSASDDISECGNAECGNTFTNIETTIYEGLLVDETAGFDINQQQLKFQVIGFESLFDRVVSPPIDIFSGLWDDFIYQQLNDPVITNILTVDMANINTTITGSLNDSSVYEGNLVTDTLQKLLLYSNSSLYIKDRVVYVISRIASIDLKYSFYGVASDLGIENANNIINVKAGVNKLFNKIRIESSFSSTDTPPTIYEVQDNTSIDNYGLFYKVISVEGFGGIAELTDMANSYLDEYGFPKVELDLTTRFWYDTLDLNFMDRVNIDYPAELTAEYGAVLPIFGVAIFGVDRFPYGKWHYVITQDKNFKILNKQIDFKNQTITFKLREI